MPLLQILLVHAQRTFSAALARLLDREPDLQVVGAVPSITAARAAIDTLHPDVVVIGTHLEGHDDGLQLTGELSTSESAPRVVIVADGPAYVDHAVAAVRAGAGVVVPSDLGASQLAAAIREAAQGHAWLPPQLLVEVLHELVARPVDDGPTSAVLARLTEREYEILRYLVAGLDRASIADDLRLSPNTVRTHVGNILRKLEVHSTLEAVALAYASGVSAGEPTG